MHERRVELTLRHGEVVRRGELTFKRDEPVVVTGNKEIEFLLSIGKFELLRELPFNESEGEGNPSGAAQFYFDGIQQVDHIKQQKNSLNGDDLNDKRVLLKRHGLAIGDCVYVASVAQEIKKKFPRCGVGLSTADKLVDFAQMLGAFDEVVDAQSAARVETLNKYDYVIQFDGVIEERKKDDADYFDLHFARLGESWKAPECFDVLRPRSAAASVQRAKEVMAESGFGADDYVVVICGTSNPLKTLHVLQAEKLISLLASDQPDAPRTRVLVLGSERDRMPRLDSSWAYAACESLPVAVELITRAKVVFGGDTGLTQLSAAMGVPTISYWGPTSPAFSIAHYPGHIHAVQASVECAPCYHLRAAFCDRLKSGIPECMRNVDVDSIAQIVKVAYAEARVVEDSRSLVAPAAARNVIGVADVPQAMALHPVNSAVLLDHSHTYTGGGVYLWTQAILLARSQKAMSVFVFVDSENCVYANHEQNQPDNLYVVADPKLASWSSDTSKALPWDYVLAGPPSQGRNAVMTNASHYAKEKHAHVALAVYETPEFIKAHRDGDDAEEAYWAEYKDALRNAGTALTISKPVRRSLEEWIPETVGKIRQVYPIIRNDIAEIIIGKIADRLDPSTRTNSAVMISRNMRYKDLEECASFVLDKFAAQHAYDDDPFTLHLVGSGVSKLKKRLRIPGGFAGVINVEYHEEITEAQKWSLIAQARALIHPSLFEGFGIPVAEAMYAGTPVLCHRLEAIKESFGARPTYYDNNADLLAALVSTWESWDKASTEQNDLFKKLLAAHKYVCKVYTMTRGKVAITDFVKATGSENVKQAQKAHVASAQAASAMPRVAVISTWNSKCGIAETTRQILGCARFPYKVFAPVENEAQLVERDGGNVVRCWDKQFISYGELLRCVQEFGPDVVHIEHEFSFFNRTPESEQLFLRMLGELRALGIKVSITLHTFAAHIGFLDRLSETVDYIVTTKDHSGDRVKNLHHINLPIDGSVYRIGNDEAKERLSWTDRARFVVGAFGMWGEHKGFEEFLKTYDDVSVRVGSETRYSIVGFRHPNNQYAQGVIRRSSDMVNSGRLKLFVDYIPMKSVIATLCAANVLVFNYRDMSHSSASAAIRTGMVAGRPIVCTNSAMFEEFENEKHVLKVPFGDTAALANAIVRLRNDQDLANKLVQECDAFVRQCSPEKIAEHHLALFYQMSGK